MVLHLWRNKEEILNSVAEYQNILDLARNRRLTSAEILDLNTHLLDIESWAGDLPEQLTAWERIRSWFGK